MEDDTNWTLPRRLTFSGRMWLTWLLFSLHCRTPVAWLKIVWLGGATASMSPTNQLPAKLLIESERRQESITLTITKRKVTEK